MSKKPKKEGVSRRVIGLFLALIGLTVLAWFANKIYSRVYTSNVRIHGDRTHICIPTGASFEEVVSLLSSGGFIRDASSFRWVAEQMNYPRQIKPGRYKLSSGMSNRSLVSKLRSGDQDPVRITIGVMRTVQELAGLVSRKIEADSASLVFVLRDRHFLELHGYSVDNSISIFIPNTYELYWNTSAEGFVERMLTENKRFWDADRLSKVRNMGLDRHQVMIIASIVEQETRKNDEKALVAGVYLNRFRKGWKLEADPTLVYALGDFSIRRVLNQHKLVESPYNTYLHTGLPPGPICVPSIRSIDAVLENKQHPYYFFCARSDFSGYHTFARTYQEHLRNARNFQRDLDRRGIRS
jgi:UPF0755 protein